MGEFLNEADLRPRSRWAWFSAAVAALALVGLVCSYFSSFLVMASDNCFAGDSRAICSTAGQQAVLSLPWVGWFAAIAGSFAMAGLAVRRGWGPWPGLYAGPILYGIPIAIAWWIAESG